MDVSGDVSIWESQLRAGMVPPVCIKSGQPAGGSLTFEFVTLESPMWSFLSNFVRASLLPSRIGPVRGPLPLTRPWLWTLNALWGLQVLGVAVVFICFLLILFMPQAPVRALRIFILGGGAVGLVAYRVLSYVRPQGDVHRAASGELWVHLREVHPNFAGAFQRSQLTAMVGQVAVQLSPDGRWYWDGSQWLAKQADVGRSLDRAARRQVPVWGILLGMAAIWTLIGGLAWWSFHR